MKDESEFHLGDMHGQPMFNYRHPHIHDGQEADFMLRAFRRDFEVNGPSVVRIARTTLAGWQRYKDHPDLRIRRRFAWESRELGHVLLGRRLGPEAVLPPQSAMRAKMSLLLARSDTASFAGSRGSRLRVAGPIVLWKIAAGGKTARRRLDL